MTSLNLFYMAMPLLIAAHTNGPSESAQAMVPYGQAVDLGLIIADVIAGPLLTMGEAAANVDPKCPGLWEVGYPKGCSMYGAGRGNGLPGTGVHVFFCLSAADMH